MPDLRLATLALALVLLAAPAAARADALTPTLGQPLYEVSHTVDVRIADGVATYKVQRVFANPGLIADEAGLEIDLPYGAAATGLRIRAKQRWYDGELLEAQEAARLYQEMTGLGSHQAKDPALLQWLWADKLYLQIFPVFPGGTSTVEYTLTAPTRYDRGRVFVSYPRLAADAEAKRGLATPIVRVQAAYGDATTLVKIDGRRVGHDAAVVLDTPPPPAGIDRVELDPAASYAFSALEVADQAAARGSFTRATVTLDIDHTYKSDLQVALLPPTGAPIVLHAQGGGDGNDLRGGFPVTLPAGTRGIGTWRLIVSDHVARDAGTLASWSLTLGEGKRALTTASLDVPQFVPDAPESASDAGVAIIEIGAPPIDTLATRLGRVVASAKHAFLRLELDAAPTLRPLPSKAQVVFVIDASHSTGQAGIDAQLAIAAAYLSHVPDAEFEIVLFRRSAERLLGGFAPAARLSDTLGAARKAGQLGPGNGSDLELGLASAASALRGRQGPTRIVVTTDALLRTRFDRAAAITALAAAPRRTVVHVALPQLDDDAVVTLARDDGHDLAPIAAARGGILATLTGLPARKPELLAAGVLGLVRPVQIDSFRVTGVDLTGAVEVPDTLHEGAGLRAMASLPAAPTEVVLEGKIWGEPYRRVVRVSRAFSKATAAIVFGEDEHHELSDAEMMTVALLGRAVSPVTSYLAAEPGVRPSTAGIQRGTSGFGSGSGGLGSSGFGSGGGGRVPPDLMALLRAGRARCVDAHKPAAGWTVALAVETTLDEVVDVAISAGAAEPITACLVEVVWDVRLTPAFDLVRESFALRFR